MFHRSPVTETSNQRVRWLETRGGKLFEHESRGSMETQTEHFAGFRVNSTLQSCLWTDVWTHLPACLPACLPECLRFRRIPPFVGQSFRPRVERPSKWPSSFPWCVHRIWLFQRRAFLFPRSTGTARITINIYEALSSSPWLVVFIQPTDQECLFTSLSDVHPFDIFIVSASSTSRPFLPRSCAMQHRGEKGKRRIKRKDNEEKSSRWNR